MAKALWLAAAVAALAIPAVGRAQGAVAPHDTDTPRSASPPRETRVYTSERDQMRQQISDLQRQVQKLRADLDETRRQTTKGVAVASTTFDGTVQAVSPREVDVRDEEGNLYHLKVDDKTRVFSQGKRIPVRQLSEGAEVRTSFELIAGEDHARVLDVVPPQPLPQIRP